MTERTQTRRRQRRAKDSEAADRRRTQRRAKIIIRGELSSPDDDLPIRVEPGWVTCRRCRQPFRTAAYWTECYDCYLDSHPTPAA